MKTVGLIALVILIALGVYAYTAQAPAVDDAAMQKDDTAMHNDAMEDKDAMMEDEAMVEANGAMEDGTITADVMVDTDTSVKVFNLTGWNFAFSETEMRVKEGDTVTVNFESTDGFHDWVVDEFDAATEKVQTNGTTSVTFVADKKGSYEYYCSVGSHRAQGMVGTLIVE